MQLYNIPMPENKASFSSGLEKSQRMFNNKKDKVLHGSRSPQAVFWLGAEHWLSSKPRVTVDTMLKMSQH